MRLVGAHLTNAELAQGQLAWGFREECIDDRGLVVDALGRANLYEIVGQQAIQRGTRRTNVRGEEAGGVSAKAGLRAMEVALRITETIEKHRWT